MKNTGFNRRKILLFGTASLLASATALQSNSANAEDFELLRDISKRTDRILDRRSAEINAAKKRLGLK